MQVKGIIEPISMASRRGAILNMMPAMARTGRRLSMELWAESECGVQRKWLIKDFGNDENGMNQHVEFWYEADISQRLPAPSIMTLTLYS
jgi:hypothetical protein